LQINDGDVLCLFELGFGPWALAVSAVAVAEPRRTLQPCDVLQVAFRVVAPPLESP